MGYATVVFARPTISPVFLFIFTHVFLGISDKSIINTNRTFYFPASVVIMSPLGKSLRYLSMNIYTIPNLKIYQNGLYQLC
ncbi:hypothetical protein F4823DRAFT_174269 [Ustulina deusta]|nr:hypothetical protein F4823DRAFT_174269 [Ustulina deusta]